MINIKQRIIGMIYTLVQHSNLFSVSWFCVGMASLILKSIKGGRGSNPVNVPPNPMQHGWDKSM